MLCQQAKGFCDLPVNGANRKDLGKLAIVEQVILSLLALVIVILIFNILAFNILQIAAVVDYLTFSDLCFIVYYLYNLWHHAWY